MGPPKDPTKDIFLMIMRMCYLLLFPIIGLVFLQVYAELLKFVIVHLVVQIFVYIQDLNFFLLKLNLIPLVH